MIKPVYEFILWPNCSNNCRFCWQKQQLKQGKLHKLSFDEKTQALSDVYHFLLSEKFEHGSHVMLVGGELFDDKRINSRLLSLLESIVLMMRNEDLDLLYINTNLIYKDLNCVHQFLTLIDTFNLWSRLRFTTSYDLSGRFTKKTEELMRVNLWALTTRWSKLRPVVNIIMTKPMCEAILSCEFSLSDFCDRYHCTVHLIPYIVLDPLLTPSLSLIVQTLKSYYNESELVDYVQRLDLNQDKRLYQWQGQLDYVSAPTAECGHSVNFRDYGRGSCYICDLKQLLGL